MDVTTPEKKWTDHRLDDLSKKVDTNHRDLKAEMNTRFDKVDAQFAAINGTLFALHRLLIRVGIGGAVAFAVALFSMFANQLI